jgi:peptide/nickel transport system permease protein
MATSSTPTTLSEAGDLAEPRETTSKGRERKRLNPSLLAGVTILGIVLLTVIFVPILSPYSATEPDLTGETFADPSLKHPLGTDNFGRDTFTRIAQGGRIDLMIAVFATFVTVMVGTTVGLLSGFYGGVLDSFLMRVVDVAFAFPFIVLVIGIIAILGTGAINVFIAIWAVGWVAYARIVRGETMVSRRLEYVEAAQVIGMHNVRVMMRHILPNVITAAVIYSMADAVFNILTAAGLSFLGLGVQPPHPEWGLMIAESRDFFLRDWKLTTFPGLAILVVGAGFSLVGDGLADLLRPRK